jgi:hypothetical protein
MCSRARASVVGEIPPIIRAIPSDNVINESWSRNFIGNVNIRF